MKTITFWATSELPNQSGRPNNAQITLAISVDLDRLQSTSDGTLGPSNLYFRKERFAAILVV